MRVSLAKVLFSFRTVIRSCLFRSCRDSFRDRKRVRACRYADGVSKILMRLLCDDEMLMTPVRFSFQGSGTVVGRLASSSREIIFSSPRLTFTKISFGSGDAMLVCWRVSAECGSISFLDSAAPSQSSGANAFNNNNNNNNNKKHLAS